MTVDNNNVQETDNNTTKMTEEVQEIDTTVYNTELSITDNINNMITEIETLNKDFSKKFKIITQNLKTTRKEVTKAEKKKTKRKQDPNKERKPSGITCPVPISEELRDFFGLEEGVLVARTVINKLLANYVEDNKLKNPEDKRRIMIDTPAGKKLRGLLHPTPPDDLTFFNIQTYLRHHYIKKDAQVETEAPVAAPVDAPAAKEDGTTSSSSVKEKTVRRVRKVRKEVESA